MTDLIVFNHNDLDALGCYLNIEFKMPNVSKKYFYTNYANIPKLVDEIIDYAEENSVRKILIPDVSFGDNKESLKRLYEYFDKVVHIDHHLYSDGFWDDFPNMTVVYDKSKCATKLCNEFFKNTGKNENLDKLTKIIDVYDLWQTKSSVFDFAQDLNEYFWTYDLELLGGKLIENNFKLLDDFSETVSRIKATYTADIQKYEKSSSIKRARDITFCFIDNWFNQVLIKEMNSGQNFVIGINSRGIVRVRINQDSPYANDQKSKLRIALTGTDTIGHQDAFTYKIKDFKGFDNIINEAKKIDLNLREIFS